MTVLITLTIPSGGDAADFKLYSNSTGSFLSFEESITAAQLTAGYTTSLVPNGTTIIRAESKGLCDNYIDINVTLIPPPTTTTTTTTVAPTTTTTTSSTSTSSTTTTTTTTIYSPICGTFTVNIIDLSDATGNDGIGERINGIVYVKYRGISGTEVKSAYNLGIQTYKCGNYSLTGTPYIYYYKNNILTVASNSNITFSGISCTADAQCVPTTTTTTTTISLVRCYEITPCNGGLLKYAVWDGTIYSPFSVLYFTDDSCGSVTNDNVTATPNIVIAGITNPLLGCDDRDNCLI